MSPTRSPRTTIAVLASCGVFVSLMHTLVVPILGEFPRLLHTSASNASWLVTATLVAGAVSAPLLGRLADMYGKRRILLVALAVMTIGSLIGALANSFPPVLFARILQGVALGVVPLGIAVMRDVLPPDRVASGAGLMSSTMGIGGAIGLPAAGLVVQHTSWHWLFATSAMLGVVEFVLVLRVVEESPDRPGGRFDLVGAVGLSAGLVMLLLVISKATAWGWASPLTLGLLAGAVVVLYGWGRYEHKAPRPLVDLRISVRRPVLLTNIAAVLVGFAMFASFVTTPQMLQAPVESGYGFGFSLVLSGIAMLPAGIMMATLSPVSARLSRHRGPRTTLMVGAGTLVLGNLLRGVILDNLAIAIASVFVVSAGAALSFAALPTLIMQAVPTSETASANSINTLMRTVGTSGCSAVVGALVAGLTVHLGGIELAAESAYRITYLLATLSAVIGMTVAAFIPLRGGVLDRRDHAPAALSR